jgi:thiol-disulfide isomerase/thioredoxin
MIERILVLSALVLLSGVAYVAFNGWRLRNARHNAGTDTLLANFHNGIPGVVVFTADYCGPCVYQQKPALVRLASETEVQIFTVDVEKDPKTAERWGVLSLPTTYILDREGKPRGVNHGVASAEKLKRQLEGL